MALNPKFTNLAVNTKATAQAVLLNSGFLDIYDGTQPVTADTAVGAQVKLAHLAFSATAFVAPAVGGVATANAITGANALATSTATWFRAYQADGVTAVYDGSVGAATSNLVLNSVAISSGAAVSVTSFTMTEGKG
jgi:hypothetical protein